ncbi:hypothetical protein [Brevundimonas sp. UBA2416]|uniref:hypothetical protein n=1 Tax=Brevundimonas sp. UBA2416 TaxID=1946124 RepID=UPI0025BD838B|nr:hypothetical protein [Brevundimonas sp. UBA2416]HRJ63574.1 hypothetical protein [Brevundimonas sp.]
MRKSTGSLARWAFWLAAVIATVIGWWQFLWPPIAFYRARTPSPGGADILAELIKPNNAIYGEPLLGWAFLLSTAVIGLFIIHWSRGIADYLQNSRVGISVLETVMEVEMHDAARTQATIRRRQTFHANRRGITAYRFGAATDAKGGRILRPTMKQTSMVANQTITKELLIRGSESNLEVIEVFLKELPTSLVATFLPNWLVCMLHTAHLFDGIVVTRTGESKYENEFSGPEGVYSVSTTKYPISRTVIRVLFQQGHEPPDGNVRGFLIRENVVEEVALSRSTTPTHSVYEVKANSLHMESLRVQWVF